MSKTVNKDCLCCGKNFEARLSEIKRGSGKFCDLKCVAEYRFRINPKPKAKPNCICIYCKKEFYKCESKKKKSRSGLHFCCRKHKDLGQRLESGLKAIHPPHYGDGKWTYRRKAFEEYEHKCNKCGWGDHIPVLEVHHKDRNRKNDNIDNLEILCPTCHLTHHFLEKTGKYGKKCGGRDENQTHHKIIAKDLRPLGTCSP